MIEALYKKLDSFAALLARGSIACGAALMILLVVLTVEQVIARYFFSASSIALQELELVLFGGIFLSSMGGALRRGRHVRVDIFYDRMPPRTQALIDSCGTCLFLLPTATCLIVYGIGFCAESHAFANLMPADRITSALFDPGSTLYQVLLPVETLLRRFLLVGETSANPGGLEGIWIMKALIPLGGLLLFVEGLAFGMRPWFEQEKRANGSHHDG